MVTLTRLHELVASAAVREVNSVRPTPPVPSLRPARTVPHADRLARPTATTGAVGLARVGQLSPGGGPCPDPGRVQRRGLPRHPDRQERVPPVAPRVRPA